MKAPMLVRMSVLAFAVAVLFAISGPAISADQHTKPSHPVCEAAKRLVKRGEPQRALELIAKARFAVPADLSHHRCAAAYSYALRRAAHAAKLVIWVQD